MDEAVGGPAGRFPLLRSLALVAGLAVAGSASAGSHTVRNGETLSEIALRNGVSTAELAGANGIVDRNRVAVGQLLTIPGRTAAGGGTGPAGEHRVALGETLSEIAAANGITTAALADANGIGDHHRIVAGHSLRIPGGTAAPAAGATAGAGTGRQHRVALGETLSEIAAANGISTAALADANGIGDHHRIVAGRTLRIPGGTAAPAAASAAVAPAAAAPAPSGYPQRLRESPARLALVPTFERWAAHYGVPLDLLMATTWLESGWQNHVVSPVGAVGIGQIMPDTTAWMRDVLIREPLDPHDPDDNIRMSARYLRWLLDRTGGDVRLALGGYYQGPASVATRGLFPVTEAYVANVVSFRDRHF